MVEGTTNGTRRGFRAWSRQLKWFAGIAVVLVIALVAGLTTAVVTVRRSWPQTSGELVVPGLEGEVRVVRDDAGIPQIYADSMNDLMLAQGYVHAQDRFFEMDVRRHATAGRLSELFGEASLETDLVVRTLGWRDVAEQEVKLLQPATRNALDAYAEGVNAYLAGRPTGDISLEYTLLGLTGLDYTPEDWSAVDSLAWLKAMAWDLRGNLEEEIGRALTAAAVGPGRAAALHPDYPVAEHPPIVGQGAVGPDGFDQDAEPTEGSVPDQGDPASAPDAVAALARTSGVVSALPALLGKGDGIGSNGWVVGGEHTTSGAPILANDPHLGVSLPGVWTQVGLHCRTLSAQCPLDVAGFSFSGVPGVVIGHNRDIAWGFTNLAPDVTDLFVERLDGDEWEYDGRLRPLTTREETIEVRDGDDISLTVRSTDHGPLLSDLAELSDDGGRLDSGVDYTDDGLVDQLDQVGDAAAEAGPDTGEGTELGVSLAWTALEPRPTADALLALNMASDWDSFRTALAGFAAPGQNVVYADTEGHIGYQATGLVPIRRRGNDGRQPAAGWLPETGWTGRHIPYEDLPSVLDPEGGVITTANQAVIDPARYQPFLTSDWDQGYRSTRIGELLAEEVAAGGIDVERMAAVQLDEWSAMGAVLTPYLLGIDLPAGYYSDGQRLLRGWDHQERADSAAAAYFNVVWREVLRRTFTDELPEGLAPDGGDRWFSVVTGLLQRPSSPWWDDVETEDVVEKRDDVLEAALLAARDELTARQSPKADEWTWGALHELDLRSSTLGESGIGVVEALFNRGGWDVGGGSSIVNATGWDASATTRQPQGTVADYGVVTAPSMRMVVPMDDLDAARWINLTGVSGHAFHPHYTDQTDLWARGDTLPWAFGEDAVEDAGEDVLTLQPQD
ncbi:penicillin acylase family protein [Nocardioides caeni]|uniref:Penicillin acylase family protein n=1 Tax=Nocardioides caeni TaxID=574700 RepID=A0A4S8NG08_9ACTN|nr:penicillin acylase family protein [Nocardioides caeni]THV14802.1 penicillin acylase family protein [Nocardioides caeni]